MICINVNCVHDLLGIEIDPGDHEVTASDTARLVCAICLD